MTHRDDRSVAVAAFSLQNQLRQVPVDQWKRVIADTAAKSGVDMEIFARSDIAGKKDMLDDLKRGRIAYLQAGDGESWALEGLNEDYVLAIKAVEPDAHRGLLEWGVTLLFYAAIALVIMIWIWPLRRRPARARERGSALRQQELAIRCGHQAAFTDISSGGDVPQDGGADRRTDRLS